MDRIKINTLLFKERDRYRYSTYILGDRRGTITTPVLFTEDGVLEISAPAT
jgi:hypothetical protein